jgi:hypothetical protein
MHRIHNVLGNRQIFAEGCYGLRFRDTGSGYEYARAGAIAGYAASETVPDALMPIHAGMKRCVVGYDGVVNYYLAAINSMWKDGTAREQSIDNADGIVSELKYEYAAGTITISVPKSTADDVGKYINIFDGFGANFWYALIVGADKKKNEYTLSHPHIANWGAVGDGRDRYYMIGNAKLDGQDGNVMVEIPGFWHRHRYEPSVDDVPANLVFRGWQEHIISERRFPGAKYYPKRYVAAFEESAAMPTA